MPCATIAVPRLVASQATSSVAFVRVKELSIPSTTVLGSQLSRDLCKEGPGPHSLQIGSFWAPRGTPLLVSGVSQGAFWHVRSCQVPREVLGTTPRTANFEQPKGVLCFCSE